LTICALAAFQLAKINVGSSGAGVCNVVLDTGDNGLGIWDTTADAGTSGFGVCNIVMDIGNSGVLGCGAGAGCACVYPKFSLESGG